MIDQIPITVLAGFLGSGKSTLLNALLRSGELPPTAVVINEFGETPIDNALVEGVTEGISVLSGGCVCCAVRTDLEATLRDLALKRTRGIISRYEAVIVEASGLAEPAPILQTICDRPMRELGYRFAGLVSTVDAVHGLASLASFEEARQQIALADRLVLTKSDLVSDTVALQQRIAELNPRASMLAAVRGAVPADWVIQSAGSADEEDLLRVWADDHHHAAPHDHGTVASITLWFDDPLDWEKTRSAIERLLRHHGSSILRLKGILYLEGVDEPVAIHAVHHRFYPVDRLDRPQKEDRRSRIVIIAQSLSEAEIRSGFSLG